MKIMNGRMPIMKQLKKWFATSSLLVVGLLLQATYISAATAAPFTPASDAEVLVRLTSLPVTDAGETVAADELTAAAKIANAQQLLALAYRTGNEDAYGQAEALLQPWSDAEGSATARADAPVEVLLMLARIRQHNHDFATARTTLSTVLAQQPNHAQARMERAQIQLVTGNYAQARTDCQALVGLVSNALVANCMAQVNSVTGQAQLAYEQLSSVTRYRDSFSTLEYTELLLTLATTAHRLGNLVEAETAYQAVLQQEQYNGYALLHYADLLLEQARAAEALQLLQALPAAQRSLELQVKELEAQRMQQTTAAFELKAQELAATFAIALARGDPFPHKEYARFLLADAAQSQQALASAQANWLIQKEPADLLLLVRAARAAGEKAALDLARRWLADTGLEDRRIEAALHQ